MTTFSFPYPAGADVRDVARTLRAAVSAAGGTLDTAPAFDAAAPAAVVAGTIPAPQVATVAAAVAATTADPNAPWRVLDVLQDRAAQALATNDAFLAIGAPTQAQVLAQVRVLTRECSGIIRLLLGALDTTDGT